MAYLTYTLGAGKSAPDSLRRNVAAGIAGYLAINVAAFFTAIEFGIQPMLFHDAVELLYMRRIHSRLQFLP